MKFSKTLAAAAAALALAACSNDDGDVNIETPDDNETPVVETPAMVSFDVTVTNLTAGQPLSPVAVIAATDAWSLFTLGETSSVALEELAEGGDNSALIGMVDALDTGLATASGAAPIAPGATETIRITLEESELDTAYLTAVTMLVNTNDAITAARGVKLADVTAESPFKTRTISYDTGTEANTEGSGTIPGPAGGGEGFNTDRDDLDFVFVHPGVVTADDGKSTSILSEIHRWDNPVMQITVTRAQ